MAWVDLKGIVRLSCSDFDEVAPYCCESCHVDANEYGYDLMESNRNTEIPQIVGGGDWSNSEHFATVCCAVSNWGKANPERWREVFEWAALAALLEEAAELASEQAL